MERLGGGRLHDGQGGAECGGGVAEEYHSWRGRRATTLQLRGASRTG